MLLFVLLAIFTASLRKATTLSLLSLLSIAYLLIQTTLAEAKARIAAVLPLE
jgi:hypothetical protein